MGYQVAWVAVRGKPSAALLNQLRLQSIGTAQGDPWPDVRDYNGSIIGAALTNGWYLLLADSDDGWIERLTSGSLFPRISRNAEAVTCFFHEGIMASQATGWKNGRQLWFLSYDGSNGPGEYETWGQVPAEFAALREECERQQRQSPDSRVDYLFDAPVNLAEALVGLGRHANQYLAELEHVSCEVLAEKPRRAFWARLLRRSGLISP